jgi:soluble lytic murein transglycosylase-like protein
VTDPFDPEQNVMAGTRYLKQMLGRYGGDLDKALAAYNWGPGNLDRSGDGRLPKETRHYITRIKGFLAASG